jgi:capsid protein
VRDLLHPVKIYPVDVEADQVTTPSPRRMEELWIDGLILHPVTGRPTGYTILRHHPGDFFFAGHNPLEADTVKARFVLHWFSKWRPGQVRGVPVFTTALDLFNELRSFRRAELQKANLAANLTAVIETESPADDTGAQTPTPFTNIPIDRGTMAALPANTKLKQYQTGGPGATYEMFQQACLGEACRPLNYPLNLALGTSQKFNFSSARLDHINYRNGLKIERADCDAQILDKLLAAYIEEAALVPGLLPWGIESIADLPHEWHWPGFEPLDPVKDALADHSRIANGTLTWQEFWASRGKDWQDVLKQQALERDEIERFKLVFSDPMKKTQTETIDATDGKEGRRAA